MRHGVAFIVRDTAAGLLIGADQGLFRYDGIRTFRVEGDQTGPFDEFHDTPSGLLLRTRMACSVMMARAPFVSGATQLRVATLEKPMRTRPNGTATRPAGTAQREHRFQVI